MRMTIDAGEASSCDACVEVGDCFHDQNV